MIQSHVAIVTGANHGIGAATPAEVAAVIAYLASDAAALITGNRITLR